MSKLDRDRYHLPNVVLDSTFLTGCVSVQMRPAIPSKLEANEAERLDFLRKSLLEQSTKAYFAKNAIRARGLLSQSLRLNDEVGLGYIISTCSTLL
jgi:hypothetical protein